MNLKGKITAGVLALLATLGVPGMTEARHHASEAGSATVVVSDRQQSGIRHEREVLEDRTRRRVPLANAAKVTAAMRPWKIESQDTGGTLLFSDSPEYVSEDGILYQDTVQGDARVLYYHLNEMPGPRKVAVVLENMNKDKAAVVYVTRGAAGQPSADYLKVGKETQTAYFQDQQSKDVLVIPRGDKRLLREQMGETLLQQGELVYGVYDFSSETPVKVTVLMYPAHENPYKFVERAKVLPKDEQRLRGTFKGMDRLISSERAYNAEKDGVVYFTLADDKKDLFRKGVDATDGSSVVNKGNYGILYKIAIPTMGRVSTQYYLTPLGGTYAGAMNVRRDHSPKTNLLLVPTGTVYFGERPMTDFADLGVYDNRAPSYFEFSPPGASNLPVNIIMMPAK